MEISYETLKGKREHRKTHGKISFKELAGTIAKNYRSIDSETKAFVHRISGLMDVHLRELRENYTDVDNNEGSNWSDKRGSSLSRDGSLSLAVLKKHGKKRRKKKFVDNVAPVVSAPEVAGAKKKVREMMSRDISISGGSPAHVGSAAAARVVHGSTPQMMELIQEQKRFLEERRRVIGGHQGVLSPSGVVAHPQQQQQQVYGVSTRSLPQVGGPHPTFHHGFRHPMPFGGHQPRQLPTVAQRPAPHNSDHEALVQQYMSQMRSGSATSSTSPRLAQGPTTSDYEAKLALFMSLKGNEGKPIIKSLSPPATTQDVGGLAAHQRSRSRSTGASPEQLLEKTDEEINRLTLEMNHALRRRQEHERRIQALHGQLTPPLQQDHHSMRSFHPHPHLANQHHHPYHAHHLANQQQQHHHSQQMLSTAANNMAQHHHPPQQYSHAHHVGVLPPHPQASSSSQSHYLKMMSGLGSDYLARLESEVMEEALLRKLM